MTKSQFLEECNSLDYCYDFLCENDIYTISDRFFHHDSYDEEISSIVENWEASDWERLRDFLYDLPTGYWYYWRNDDDQFEGLSDRNDLDDMIDRILEEMDGQWDPEDDEEESDIEDDEEDEYEEEIVSIGSFEDDDIIGLANFSTEIYVGAKEERPVDWNNLW